jgi:hypothetical protein
MQRPERFALAYVAMGIVAVSIALTVRDGSPLSLPDPWLPLSGDARHAYSLLLGLAVGSMIAAGTRPMVHKVRWARRLHEELRPFASEMSPGGIIALALLSSVAEELLFRGLLQPWLGLVPQALVFGLIHQLPGRSRWVWVTWATMMGLVLGSIFQLTGSLLGPIGAHALINGLNLTFLKRHDPVPEARPLGGLLRKPAGAAHDFSR